MNVTNDMKNITLLCLLLFAFGITFAATEQSVAVLPTDGEAALNPNQTNILTNKMREAALKVLPMSKFSLLKQDAVYNRLGGMANYQPKKGTRKRALLLGQQPFI